MPRQDIFQKACEVASSPTPTRQIAALHSFAMVVATHAAGESRSMSVVAAVMKDKQLWMILGVFTR
jgi:hypothetical protein